GNAARVRERGTVHRTVLRRKHCQPENDVLATVDGRRFGCAFGRRICPRRANGNTGPWDKRVSGRLTKKVVRRETTQLRSLLGDPDLLRQPVWPSAGFTLLPGG